MQECFETWKIPICIQVLSSGSKFKAKGCECEIIVCRGRAICCGKYELVVRFGTAAAQEEGLTIDCRRLESLEEEFGEVDWDNVPQPFASNFKKIFSSFQGVESICSASLWTMKCKIQPEICCFLWSRSVDVAGCSVIFYWFWCCALLASPC